MSCDVNSNSQSAFNNHRPQVKEFLSKQISLSLIHQLQSLFFMVFFFFLREQVYVHLPKDTQPLFGKDTVGQIIIKDICLVLYILHNAFGYHLICFSFQILSSRSGRSTTVFK